MTSRVASKEGLPVLSKPAHASRHSCLNEAEVQYASCTARAPALIEPLSAVTGLERYNKPDGAAIRQRDKVGKPLGPAARLNSLSSYQHSRELLEDNERPAASCSKTMKGLPRVSEPTGQATFITTPLPAEVRSILSDLLLPEFSPGALSSPYPTLSCYCLGRPVEIIATRDSAQTSVHVLPKLGRRLAQISFCHFYRHSPHNMLMDSWVM